MHGQTHYVTHTACDNYYMLYQNRNKRIKKFQFTPRLDQTGTTTPYSQYEVVSRSNNTGTSGQLPPVDSDYALPIDTL